MEIFLKIFLERIILRHYVQNVSNRFLTGYYRGYHYKVKALFLVHSKQLYSPNTLALWGH